ncbi:ABC transporter permease [Alicyclobacillus suci]|uniref:ABC transporter permease n=1 Tax=Alicyclobacillus suci TaxID=2816080 RepID=UPI001A8E54DC|nr:ABC transporter permease [Alicyclobacillus suci]
MWGLILNENAKIYRRSRTWIFVGIVLLALLALCMLVRKSIPPSAHVWGLMNTSSGLITLITIFAAVVGGDIVAAEFSTGTAKLLFMRPVSRLQILWSKYIAVLLFALGFVALLFVASWVLGGLVLGFDGATTPYQYVGSNQEPAQIPYASEVLRSYAFPLVPLVMTLTVSFMISTLFRSSSLAIAVSILLLFAGAVVVTALSRYAWDKYILFANTNLSQYFVGGPSLKGMSLGFSVVVLIVYFVVFHLVAAIAFRKRDVAV